MKNIILLAIFIIGGSFWYKKSTCEPVAINFAGKEWLFPSTVEDAVKKHQLNYKPPGYYYKIDSMGMEVLLDYHFNSGDFFNENQPKETLYLRSLHSYVFRFDDRAGLYDSLKTNLEQVYKSKFVMTKGLKDSKYAEEKTFEYNFLKASPCLTIGIKSTTSKTDGNKVVVRFMYDLSLGRMGVHMGNY